MANQSITVELADETIRALAALGEPGDVVAQLAGAAADGLRRRRSTRDHTDQSLRVERDKSDVAIAEKRTAVEETADEVVRLARQRADRVVQTARADADEEVSSTATTDGSSASERARLLADNALRGERSTADAVLVRERAEGRHSRSSLLADERGATDRDLTGERTSSDATIVDLREANEQMVASTIRAHELAIEADEATQRAERVEAELRDAAGFREMFIGILGHDLRNPLGAITMGAGMLLRRGRLDEQDALTVGRIIRSSQRMTRLIAQVLDLTRARVGGGLPLELKPTDLAEVCRDVVAEFEAATQLDVEGDLTGSWDEDRLAELLSNLTANAIEYALRGTAVIVRARADGADVVVEVENQGDPIPADVLPVLFEPFRRARQHDKSAAGNLGLGLYIAHEIVLSHGGTLEARSAGGTTTFTLRLPRRPPPPEAAPAPPAS